MAVVKTTGGVGTFGAVLGVLMPKLYVLIPLSDGVCDLFEVLCLAALDALLGRPTFRAGL